MIAQFPANTYEITVEGLKQWDTGQELEIVLSAVQTPYEVHFSNRGSMDALRVEAKATSSTTSVVKIPNIILTSERDAIAWIYTVDGDKGTTVRRINLPIEKRAKPEGYLYEENVPGVVSGSSVDATILVEHDYNTRPTTMNVNQFRYDESEILNVANKLVNKEAVNIKIYGNYSYWSSSGYYGDFTTLHVEHNYYELVVTFLVDSSEGCVLYRLKFGLDGWDSTEITGVKLTRASQKADTTIELYTYNDESTGIFTADDVRYDDHEIINAWNKTLSQVDVDIKIVGNHWAKGYGYRNRTFIPLMYEAHETGNDEGILEVVLMMKQDTGLEVMKITFTIGANSTVTHSVTTNN